LLDNGQVIARSLFTVILGALAALTPAVPCPAIDAILDAYAAYQIVALGEGPHGNEQGYAFRLSLIRDPRFPSTVNDIVVECGSGRNQRVIDNFVRGDTIPDDIVREVLRDSSIETPACERPIYGDFVRAVRALNLSLPTERRIRVLIGAPPIDWSRARTRADYLKQSGGREPFVFDLIEREVIAKRRRALIIYGDGHFQARSERPPRSLLARLDAAGIRTLAISNVFADFAALQPDVASWPVPSVAMIRDTPIGAKPFSWFYGATPPGVHWPMELDRHFDAILYLGPPSTMTISRMPPDYCRDEAALRERKRRLAFMPGNHGQEVIKALEQYCAAQH
jgi:hypothetical protein